MGIGIALGAFTGGLKDGYDVRRQFNQDQQADAARKKEQEGRDRLDAIQRDTIDKFEQQGSENGKKTSFEDFWTTYALPKMRNEMLLQGNYDGAKALMDWGETADAKKGGKLFSSAMLKIQTGDVTGAMDDAMKAAKLKGYLDAEYDFTGYTPIQDGKTGEVRGYRLSFTDANGEEIQSDVPVEKMPELVATYLNPETAWASQAEAQKAAAKQEQELSTYEAKKQIDQRYGGGNDDQKLRAAAIKNLRERMSGALYEGTPFDDLSRAEQEKLISDELALQSGAAPPPQAAMIVDTQSGQAVGLSAPQQQPVAPSQPAAAGISAAPQQQAAPTQTPPPAQSQNSAALGIAPSAAKVPTNRREEQAALKAHALLFKGENPQKVAEALLAEGFTQDELPSSLRQSGW